MSAPLAIIERPNGKVYRARKGLIALAIDNDHLGETEILVLRTHDVDRARRLAEQVAAQQGIEWSDDVEFVVSWARETIRDHEPFWEYDDVRGVPCIVFSPER